MSAPRALVVMAKAPIPGQVKTRLTPTLNPEQAAKLARCFLLDEVAMAKRIPGCDIVLAYTPPDTLAAFPTEVVEACTCIPQPAGDLGTRMSGIFNALFAQGYSAVVLIGSDLPTLPAATVRAAFDGLAQTPVAIAPADDGGYCLIGLTAPAPGIFQDIDWGTDCVYTQTTKRLDQLGLEATRLLPCYDVDTPPDLAQLATDINARRDAGDPALPQHTGGFLAGAGLLYGDPATDVARTLAEVAVIIPALNEEAAIGRVVSDIPPEVGRVVVVDNGSTDATAAVAAAAGAEVIAESQRGYGYACWTGMQHASNAGIYVFLDGDYSDYPAEMADLVAPIAAGEADMVIGSRLRGERQPGAMLWHAYLANILFSRLLSALCGLRVTDIGPFRAARADALRALDLQEFTYGWTLEMMIKAARQGLRTAEVPVSYRRRLGRSKVSGSLVSSLKAGIKMFYTLRYCWQ